MRLGLGAVLGAALCAFPALAQGEPPPMRWVASPEALQLEVRLDRPASWSEEITDQAYRLRFDGLEIPPSTCSLPHDPYLRGLSWESAGTASVLNLAWPLRMPTRLEASGSLLTLTLQRVFASEATATVAPGLIYHAIRRGTVHGPVALHVLEASLTSPLLRIAPALAPARCGFALAPTSQIARAQHAVAAINGSYFGAQGAPLGLLVIDGQIVSGPIYARTALALGSQPAIERSGMTAFLELPGGQSLDVDGVNQPRWDDMVVIYTDRYGARTHTHAPEKQPAFEAAVDAAGRVREVGVMDLAIPPGGFVVSAQGTPADWLSTLMAPGSPVTYREDLDAYWEGARNVLGAGPRLLEGGEIRLAPESERFRSDIALGRSPRSAVGLTADQRLIAVVVDGRSAGSIGMTLLELATCLRDLGAREALNLDGGGSSTMVIDGRVVNHPSDGHERPVSDALVFTSEPP